jgi:YD repeat-containing protein
MKMINRVTSKLLIAALLVTSILCQPVSVNAKISDKQNIDRARTEILVKYKDASKADNIRNSVKSKMKLNRLNRKTKFKNPKFEVIEIDISDNIEEVLGELKKNTGVEYAQPNYKLAATEVSPDELYEEQWGLSNTAQRVNGITGIKGIDINAEQAWGLTEGNTSTVVGILDTGVDISHKDLAASIYINPGEIPGNGLDDDGNGYIDDVNGWDFANSDNTVFDSASEDKHGTHVAGIIAAGTNNGGIKGVAPGIKILPLKFITSDGGYTSDAIEAIEYAKALGVKIINCSFGGSQENYALRDAMASSGILFICSAGNKGQDTAVYPLYPASLNLPNIISVASINSSGELAGFSNFGTDVDIAAPGVNILGTVPGDKYEMQNGTSTSTAFVTGIAALLASRYADMTVGEMAARIKEYSVKSPVLSAKVSAGGYADAYGALTGTVLTQEDGQTGDNESKPEYNIQDQDAILDIQAVTVSQTLLEQIHYGEKGVNIASGNYSRSAVDMSVSAPGFQVNISRTYNSKDNRTAKLTMGKGWFFGFEGSFKRDSGSTWVAKLPDGSAQVFILSGSTYTANDSRSTLVINADNTYTLTTKDQYTYGFNKSGYLTWMKDRNGNAIEITVDDKGLVQKVTDTVGRVYNISYTGGRITSISDPLGRKAIYEYDNSGLLKKAYLKSPSGTVEGAVEEYSYDAQGYLSQVKITDPVTGAVRIDEEITYDHSSGSNQHKVSTYKDRYNNTFKYTYDVSNRKTTITDTTGRQLIKWYDTRLYTIKSKDPEGMTTQVEYYVDKNGVNVYGEEKSIIDRNGNKTSYERDDRGNITKITNPDGSFREYTYNNKNNLTMETDEEGNRTYYIYDDDGINLIKKAQPINGTDEYSRNTDPTRFAVTSYMYYTIEEAQRMGCSVKGLLKSEIDPEGAITTYTYDKNGNVKSVINADGGITINEYNIIGWLLSTESPMRYRTEYTYDNCGRVVRIIQDGGETTRIVYDAEGRILQEISPNQYKLSDDGLNDAVKSYIYKNSRVGTVYKYDPLTGLLKTVTQYLDNGTVYVTSYTYDIYGNVNTETKPNNTRYYYEYDVMNRLIRYSFADNASDGGERVKVLAEYSYLTLADGKTQKVQTRHLNDAETAITTETFDYAGRQIQLQNADGGRIETTYYANGLVHSVTNANGATTYFRYDGLSRLTGKWEPIELGRYMYTGYKYDKAGRIIEELKSKDKVEFKSMPASDRVITRTMEYDIMGWLTMESDSTGKRITYAYDREGNLIRRNIAIDNDTVSSTEYEYNHLGKPVIERAIVQSRDIYGSRADYSTMEIVTSYRYDKNGNLTEITYPDGGVTKYTYDSLNRRTSTGATGLDENGNPAVIVSNTEYEWDGQVKTITDPKGAVIEYTYNGRGMLVKQEKTATDEYGQQQKHTALYDYDLAGRKIAEVSPENYIDGMSISQMSRTEFTYDKMDRVILQKETYNTNGVWTSFVTRAYKYDAEGNIIKELDGEGYKSGDGTAVELRIETGYGTEYTYNPGGKLSTILDPVSRSRGLRFSTRYSYDGAGRKVSEEKADGSVTLTGYDDAGNITSISIKKTLYDPAQTIKTMEYDRAGNLVRQTDAYGNTTIFKYNTLGKLERAEYPEDETIQKNIVIYQYDVMGRLAMSRESNGKTTLYTYDPQGRELTCTQQDANGRNALTISKAYDINGNIVYETDANGVTKTNIYDGFNRLVQEKVTVKTSDNRLVDHITRYTYDKNGNKTSETNWLGNIWKYEYDPLNRLTARYEPGSATPVQTLEYNCNHVQTVSRDAKGSPTYFSYDKNSRLIATTDPEGHTERQDYDNLGNIAEKTDGRGNTTRYEYDQFGRLVAVTDATGVQTRYMYDLNGNLISQTDGNGNITAFEYNAANLLKRRIDSGGRTESQDSYRYEATKIETYTYYPDGSMKTKTDRNGVTTYYTYDVHGRLISQSAGEETITYTYDGNGNQLLMTDATGATARTYDELNRVVTKSVPGFGTMVFKYDILQDGIWDTQPWAAAGQAG